MSRLLEARGLHARYGNTQVLHGIDIDVDAGKVTTLLGANGAGKTTTLRALCRLMVQASGNVTLAGERIDHLPTEQIARRGVGHVPDGRGTFLGLTTEENLRLGVYSRSSRSGAEEDLARVYSYFPRLAERHRQQAGTLSGGEQQMLAIGRALMGRPRLLLLDEPSFGLAPLVVKDIFEIMRRINQEEGVSILLVEQNASLALGLADTAYLLETGRVVLSGSAAEMRNNDAVRRAYLGE
jgi:branched-chain amino acid transport system ATP-binding protein